MSHKTESPTPQQLLEDGWRARYVDAQFELAQNFFQRSLDLARRQNDKRAAGYALLAIHNNTLWCDPSVQEARVGYDELCQQALDLFRQAGDEAGIAASLRAAGDYAAALAIYRRIDDRRGIALCLERQICFAASLKRPDGLRALRYEALSIARQLDDRSACAQVLLSLGISWGDEDQASRRAVLLEAAEIFRKLGHQYNHSHSLQICAALGFDEDEASLTPDDRRFKAELIEEARFIRHDLGFDDEPT